MADYLEVRRSLGGDRGAGRLRASVSPSSTCKLLDFVAPRVGQRLGQAARAADQGRQAEPARDRTLRLRGARTCSARSPSESSELSLTLLFRAQQGGTRRRRAHALRRGRARRAAAHDRKLRDRARHGIELSCRAAGRAATPVLVFLHGFPEAAFVWDELLEHFVDALSLRRAEPARLRAVVGAGRGRGVSRQAPGRPTSRR